MQDCECIQSKAHTAGRPAPGWLKGYGEAASQLPNNLLPSSLPGQLSAMQEVKYNSIPGIEMEANAS